MFIIRNTASRTSSSLSRESHTLADLPRDPLGRTMSIVLA